MYGKSFHPWVIALTVASAILSGCAGRAGRTLDDVESYIQESPDSAFTVLEAMDTSAFFRPRDAARYSLLHTMAADKTTMDTNDVSLIAPAVRYYTRKGPLKYRMMTSDCSVMSSWALTSPPAPALWTGRRTGRGCTRRD